MSRLRLTAIAALALLLALPAPVLAATVDVTGTVTAPEGVSVAGVEIAVLVQGSDEIKATTTDEAGAWALQVDAEPGAVLEIDATGAQTRSEPDEEGCVTVSTPIGRLEVTIEELPLAAIEVPLDGAITDVVCPETPTPAPVDTPKPTPPFTGGGPAKTPPSTDTIGADGLGGRGIRVPRHRRPARHGGRGIRGHDPAPSLAPRPGPALPGASAPRGLGPPPLTRTPGGTRALATISPPGPRPRSSPPRG